MTRLVASLFIDSVGTLADAARQAWEAGADGLELRIDAFEDDPADLAAYLSRYHDRFWIITCRGAEEGGFFRGDTMQRVSTLLAAARGSGAYVDFELADFERSANIRQKVLLAAADPRSGETRLILSSHRFDGPPLDWPDLVERFRHAHPTVVWKFAYAARTIEDSFHALDLAKGLVGGARPTPLADRAIPVAMGECGLWTRILAKKLGAFATFAALDSTGATAPGQLSLHEMIHRYRWREIDSGTRVFGVVGDPVAHSMGPILFNQWFAEARLNAVYVPLRMHGGGGTLARFLEACRARPWLGVGGLSVTLPHKTAALQWAGGGGESMARGIGAANTLVFRGESVDAYNTDCYAAIASLADALRCPRSDLGQYRFDVLGAGGAARALIYGLYELGGQVTVYARDLKKARPLVDEFSVRAAPWHELDRRTGDVLVNCTNLGMSPEPSASPIPATGLRGCRLVFDLIYNPMRTRLLRDADAQGIPTLGGLDMFIRQAAMQFELWTGRHPNLETAKTLLTTELVRQAGASQ